MLEANIFFMEIFILFILIMIGFIRRAGLWFLFTMIVGVYAIIDLAYNNAFTITYISGSQQIPVTMPTAVVLLPIILITIAFASIVHNYKSAGAV